MGANSSAAVPPGYVPPPMYNKAGKPIVPKVRYGATPKPMYRPAGPAGAYYGGSSALSLDAADGVMDGRYFGAPIAGAGRPLNYARPAFVGAPTYTAAPFPAQFASHAIAPAYHHAPTYLPPVGFGGFGAAGAALSLDAADGVIDGRFFGSPIAQAPTYSGGFNYAAPVSYGAAPLGFGGYAAAPTYLPHNSGALALDAADGVIDGRFFGAPIANTSVHVPRYGAAFAPAHSAFSLDAADGVIDGRYFGAPIASTPALAGAYSPAILPQSYHGAQVYQAAPTVMTGNVSTALALDAADGRIDGKYFGANIAAPAYGQYSAPAYGGAVSIPAPQYMAPATYAGAGALALDAADGVLDGRYFGSPIVQGSAPAVTTAYGGYNAYGGTSAAAALDAADGVMDGRYYGAPIAGGARYR